MLSRTKARHHVVVAYLALFVALGGSAVAAKPLIDGADVQDESLTTLDIQNDSLTGDDILESGLGKVADADKLDGKDSTDFGALNPAVQAAGPERTRLKFYEYTAVATVNLTAGRWHLVGKPDVESNDTTFECRLQAGTNQLDFDRGALTYPDKHDNGSLIGVATLETAQDVTLDCQDVEANAPALAVQPKIVAMRAG